MSKLVKLIKSLEGKEVNTETYLKERSVSDLGARYNIPKEDQHLWDVLDSKDFNSKDFKDVLIAGYGDVDSLYGAGPTRLISHAAYDITLFAVSKDVNLVNWFITTPKLSSVITDMNNRMPFGSRNGFNPKEDGNHIIFTIGHIKKAEVGFNGIITNIHRKGLVYKGDVSIGVHKYLGLGDRFSTSMTTIDALSEVDASGKYLSGNRFQKYVSKSKQQLNNFADSFEMHPDYKIWVLTINNLGE